MEISTSSRARIRGGSGCLLLMVLVAGCARTTVLQEKPMTAAVSVPSTSSPHDFDFLVGNWEGFNRRLKTRHVGSDDWDEFTGYQTMRTVLGGIGNVDEVEFPSKGWSGLTLRLFNTETRQWSIYWANSRQGVMLEPVVGTFDRGVGTFYGDDTDDGKPIRVRYIWSRIQSDSAHWEQAFSLDGGRTWETNWTMDMRRRPSAADAGAAARTATGEAARAGSAQAAAAPATVVATPAQKPRPSTEPAPPAVEQAPSARADRCCAVLELRQYTLHPGMRDTLISLFERELIEPQEALGMQVVGTFRDAERPDRFVWLRGFDDFAARAGELRAFYGGPVWTRHRAAANATMIDASNVLLLRPAHAGDGFALDRLVRPRVAAPARSDALVAATIYYLPSPATPESNAAAVAFFDATVAPAMVAAGGPPAACFVTEPRASEFPALPVRENENVLVCFSTFRSAAAYGDYVARLNRSPGWRDAIATGLRARLRADPETLLLEPTARSLWGG